MPTPKTGVFPCYENQFKIGTAGDATPDTDIANCEEFSVSFDNGVEEWHSFGEEGWANRLMTAKSITISVKAKRTIGDAGNDMVESCATANGTAAQKNVLWNLPSGASLLLKNAVINVKNIGAGAATNVAPLEFDVMSNGKPVFTPAA